MPLDKKLLEILCCPASKVPVAVLEAGRLEKLNAAVTAGTVKYQNGDAVSEPVEEALVTEDGKTIYEIRKGIPIMLIEKGIAADQISGM